MGKTIRNNQVHSFHIVDPSPWPIISAALIVAIVPIALIIAVFQERVVGGLTQGGLKG